MASDKPVTCEYTILIDSGEQYPFHFTGIRADSNKNGRPIEAPTQRRYLGPSMGDYSLEVSGTSFVGHVSVERKSQEDAYGTFIGWGERRERFERELASLASMEAAAVVVECSLGHLIQWAPEWGKKTAAQNAKSLHRTIISWQTTWRIPWFFCDSRRLAEITTFRFLDRFYRKAIKGEK